MAKAKTKPEPEAKEEKDKEKIPEGGEEFLQDEIEEEIAVQDQQTEGINADEAPLTEGDETGTDEGPPPDPPSSEEIEVAALELDDDDDDEDADEEEDDHKSLYHDFRAQYLEANPEFGEIEARTAWKALRPDWEFDDDIDDDEEAEIMEVPEDMKAEAEQLLKLFKDLEARGDMLDALESQSEIPTDVVFTTLDRANYAKFVKDLCKQLDIEVDEFYKAMEVESYVNIVIASQEIETQKQSSIDEEDEDDENLDFEEFITED